MFEPETSPVPDGYGETIGALYDRLTAGQWTPLPEYGVQVKRAATPCCAEFGRTGYAHTEACCDLGEDV